MRSTGWRLLFRAVHLGNVGYSAVLPLVTWVLAATTPLGAGAAAIGQGVAHVAWATFHEIMFRRCLKREMAKGELPETG